MESKFVLWQPQYYNWLEKVTRNVMLLKYSFFENVLLLSISRNFLQATSLDEKFLGNFTWPNSIISVKDLINSKRVFFWNIFDWPLCWLTTMTTILEIKVSMVSIKNPCTSATHIMLGESVHTGCYIWISLVHIMYVLFICI